MAGKVLIWLLILSFPAFTVKCDPLPPVTGSFSFSIIKKALKCKYTYLQGFYDRCRQRPDYDAMAHRNRKKVSGDNNLYQYVE
jgi:hypothetical protein